MGMDCDFVATGETDQEIMDQLMAHGMAVHADQMAGMDKEKMVEKMKANIVEAS